MRLQNILTIWNVVTSFNIIESGLDWRVGIGEQVLVEIDRGLEVETDISSIKFVNFLNKEITKIINQI